MAAFMLPSGIQSVMLAYLLAIELQQPAQRFGITQMLGQLPVMVLLFVGGWLADRMDPRTLLIRVQLLAAVMPLVLAAVLGLGHLGEAMVLVYALAWGVTSAFAIPARDGLLNRVAGAQVQRVVTIAMGVQFGCSMLGQALSGQAGRWGPVGILILQGLLLMLGAWTAARLPKAESAPPQAAASQAAGPLAAVRAALGVLFSDPTIRATFCLLCAMGIFFAGVMVVLIPLAVRDLHRGGSQDIAFALIAFGVGTLTSIGALIRAGGLRMPGRALCLSQYAGCLALTPIAFDTPLWVFYLSIFVWGMCGGVAMTMSRTVLQENAPPSHRSRVMAGFSVASVGGAPLGSLLMGFAIGAFGVRGAILIPIIGVTLTTVTVMATHPLWRLRSRSR